MKHRITFGAILILFQEILICMSWIRNMYLGLKIWNLAAENIKS